MTLFKSFKKHLPPTYAALILQLCFPINSITYDNFWLFSPTYKGLNFWLLFLNSSIPIALNPNNHVVSVYPHFYRLIFKDSLDFFNFLKKLVLRISINWTNKSNKIVLQWINRNFLVRKRYLQYCRIPTLFFFMKIDHHIAK